MWSRSGSTSSERSSSLARAGDLAQPDLLGQPSDHAEDPPGEQRREGRGRQHPELRFLELLTFEGETRDQDRDREPDTGDRPASGDHRPAQRAAEAREPRCDPCGGEDLSGLPTT